MDARGARVNRPAKRLLCAAGNREPNQVPYDGVEVGWPEGFGSAFACNPKDRPFVRGGCGVSPEWLGAISFTLRAEFRGDLLVGSEFMFRWPKSVYRMTGDADGLWTVDYLEPTPEGFHGCGLPDDSPCGATGRFIRVPEPGTLALFGVGLAGLGFTRRRKAA